MSISVDIDRLAEALTDFGAGYLLTASTAGAIKAVTVEPEVIEGCLVADPKSGGSERNIAENPAVTVLFPPVAARGYTLLVDGTAEVIDGLVHVTPSAAVLHRPAAHADGPGPPDGCGHDCAPLG